jgi:lysyl-tRNA synthetase class II
MHISTIQGTHKIQYHANGPDQPPIEIDFSRPWRRISMVSGLEEALGIKLPGDLDSPETRQVLVGQITAARPQPILKFLRLLCMYLNKCCYLKAQGT